jgi:hypothetical protein
VARGDSGGVSQLRTQPNRNRERLGHWGPRQPGIPKSWALPKLSFDEVGRDAKKELEMSWVWVCVECGSLDVDVSERVDGGRLQNLARCNECGALGVVVYDFEAVDLGDDASGSC